MDDRDLFALYFGGIVGWQLHPGYQREGAQRMPLERCRDLALEMVRLTNEAFPGSNGDDEQRERINELERALEGIVRYCDKHDTPQNPLHHYQVVRRIASGALRRGDGR